MEYTYEYLREYNPQMQVSDTVIMNGTKYIITNITYEYNAEAIPTVTYTAQPIVDYNSFANIDFYDHFSFEPNEIKFRSLMDLSANEIMEDDNAWPTHEEEISDEQRNEFIKLLE